MQPDYDALISRVRDADRGAIARALRWVDDVPPVGRELAHRLFSETDHAMILGITGNPGAGKSTVVDGLVSLLRKEGKKVAVLAVDPSSPFSGGAILGDRIRMVKHFEDDGVYIRSLATRGALGGLSRATFDAVRVLDAARFDVILLETVGVGQDEVDIARLAHTTLVVTVPGLGDDVQAIKAGLLEIADIFVLNKSDRTGADDVERNLRHMMTLAPLTSEWEPPIQRTVAVRGEGLDALWEQIQAHTAFLRSDEGKERMTQQRRDMFERILDAAIVTEARGRLADSLQAARDQSGDRTADPYGQTIALLEKLWN